LSHDSLIGAAAYPSSAQAASMLVKTVKLAIAKNRAPSHARPPSDAHSLLNRSRTAQWRTPVKELAPTNT
jgi:hypothetical protein